MLGGFYLFNRKYEDKQGKEKEEMFWVVFR
jgi:hypothetical protein